MKRLLPQALGLGLIVFVAWRVGWNDRAVTDEDVEHFGRIESEAKGIVTFTDGRVVEGVRYTSEGLRGFLATLARRPWDAACGMLMHLGAFALIFLRWGLLLRGAGLETGWRTVLRLSWVGQFFGVTLPGGTATGDVVKAYYVARSHEGMRTRAIVTVFVDRAVGLLVLSLIAVGAIVLAPLDLKGGTAVKASLVAFLCAGMFVLALILSRRLRRALGLGRLVKRLPFQQVVRECGQAADVYGRRRGVVLAAFGMSFVSHGLFLGSYHFYAAAMGFDLPLLALAGAIPIAQIVSAVPGLPGGWGVGEGAFFFLLPLAGVPASRAVALSVVWRIMHTVLSLPGWFWLGHGGERIDRSAVPAT